MNPAAGARARHARNVTHRVDDLLLRLSVGSGESDLTLDEYFAGWLDQRRSTLAASSHQSYEHQYRYYIAPHLGHLRLHEVTVAVVTVWISNLVMGGGKQGRPLAAKTVSYARVLLHKALEDAVAAGDLLVNPVSRTQPPYRDTNGQRRRYPASSWTVEELQTFLRLTDTHKYAVAFVLLATTGMRRGEVLALSWSDIDLDRREVTISKSLTVAGGRMFRGAPKRGLARRIAIGDRAADALLDHQDRQRSMAARAGAEWRNDLDLVLTTSDGRYVAPGALTDAFRRLAPRLGIRRIRLHDLRHTHAILLLQAGMPVIDVSQRLGHATPAVTLDLYAHALANPGHALAEAFDRLLGDGRWANPS